MGRSWFRVLKKQPRGTRTAAGKFARAIYYHWGQLQGLYLRLTSGRHRHDQLIQNAVIEQFLVHGRVMVDAFYVTPKFGDDLTIDAVGLRRVRLPAAAKRWREAVHKRAAHLTLASKVEWEFGPVILLLKRCMARLRKHLLRGEKRRERRALDALHALKALDSEVAKRGNDGK